MRCPSRRRACLSGQRSINCDARLVIGRGNQRIPTLDYQGGDPVVARAGIEPATFHFSGGRSYRLSYLASRTGRSHSSVDPARAATPTGLEPATSAVTGRRANQLRHGASLWSPLPTEADTETVYPQRDSNPCYRLERAAS